MSIKYLVYEVGDVIFMFLCRHDIMLVIQSATGGIWKFPVRFVATEPTPDDTITIEAAGLSKTSSIGIRLTSQSKYARGSSYSHA